LKKIADVLEIEAYNLYDDYYRFLDYPYSVRIKQIRSENKLRQHQLGAMLGVTRRAVERWEHGKHTVTREMWEQLKVLNLL
jgi:DNA-binding XRE family transcriptional regulator